MVSSLSVQLCYHLHILLHNLLSAIRAAPSENTEWNVLVMEIYDYEILIVCER